MDLPWLVLSYTADLKGLGIMTDVFIRLGDILVFEAC